MNYPRVNINLCFVTNRLTILLTEDKLSVLSDKTYDKRTNILKSSIDVIGFEAGFTHSELSFAQTKSLNYHMFSLYLFFSLDETYISEELEKSELTNLN